MSDRKAISRAEAEHELRSLASSPANETVEFLDAEVGRVIHNRMTGVCLSYSSQGHLVCGRGSFSEALAELNAHAKCLVYVRALLAAEEAGLTGLDAADEAQRRSS